MRTCSHNGWSDFDETFGNITNRYINRVFYINILILVTKQQTNVRKRRLNSRQYTLICFGGKVEQGFVEPDILPVK